MMLQQMRARTGVEGKQQGQGNGSYGCEESMAASISLISGRYDFRARSCDILSVLGLVQHRFLWLV
jgi:hypothetical protein